MQNYLIDLLGILTRSCLRNPKESIGPDVSFISRAAVLKAESSLQHVTGLHSVLSNKFMTSFPALTSQTTLHFHHFSGQEVSVTLYREGSSQHELGGGRRSVNLGHPAAEAALQLMREREMKAQFDHSSLATSATATEREGEGGKSPSPRQAGSSKQQGGLYLCTPCSFSPDLSLMCLRQSCDGARSP